MNTYYDVISPDGFSIGRDSRFATMEEAEQALKLFVKRYEPQGYYSSSQYGRIPLDILPQCCEIVEREDVEDVELENEGAF
jgi:hypothetical protein